MASNSVKAWAAVFCTSASFGNASPPNSRLKSCPRLSTHKPTQKNQKNKELGCPELPGIRKLIKFKARQSCTVNL